MSANTAVSLRKRGTQYGVILNHERVGYVWREGREWFARRIGNQFPVGPFSTRRAAADALVDA